MKKYIIFAFAALTLAVGCVDLDRNPLSEGSSENWFSNEQEVVLALNALYNPALWRSECTRFFNTDRWTDDWNQRTQLYDWLGGTISSSWGQGATDWGNSYKGIARANTILYSLDKAKDALSDAQMAQYTGEAKFFRACFYSYLITLFGDVPFYTDYITLEEAYEMGRIDREVVLGHIYEDFDAAIAALPESYTATQRVTKGAAMAMKARIALYMSDWQTCATAAKACMDLGTYSLHPDFRELFLSSTKTSPEHIFALPCSNNLAIHSYEEAATRSFYPRNNGGTSVAQPSYDLFFAFPCTDGKLPWESPLYDPADPFANRDPRLGETIVPFYSEFMDYIYNPRVDASQVAQVSTGVATTVVAAAHPGAEPVKGASGNWEIDGINTNVRAETGKANVVGADGFWHLNCALVKNNDSKTGSKDSSYNGFVLKKYIDEEWIDDRLTDMPQVIIRYGDVLLMYAEAKMEMNQIDQSVFDALNSLRARAYKCGLKETSKYPAITETNQTKLRRIIRNERRIELAWENRRWFDLIRWRVCEEALTMPCYGLAANASRKANEKTPYWFFPKDLKVRMSETSIIDLSDMDNYPSYYQINVQKAFVPRQYLFPIPINERTVCPKLTQNPGY